MMTTAESFCDLRNSVIDGLDKAPPLEPCKVIREINDKTVGAVYVFYGPDGKVVYVGQTRRIVKRLKRHGGLIGGGNALSQVDERSTPHRNLDRQGNGVAWDLFQTLPVRIIPNETKLNGFLSRAF